MRDLRIPPLSEFGERIMICGTSNTGKSTLAVAIGRKLNLEVVHLDQLRFLPHTDWLDRPDDEFKALHDDAIAGDRWIIEGNYSMVWSARLARATGIILLTDSRAANFARYLHRTLFRRNRIGGLAGGKDSLKWDMAHWVLVRAPRNVDRNRAILSNAGLPFVELKSMRDQAAAYSAWGLKRP